MKMGNKYKIKYKLSLANGYLVDECMDEPMEFEVGDDTLHSCLEECVSETEKGEMQKYIIMSEKGFGERSDEAIQEMDKSDFNDSEDLKIDDAIEFLTPIGDKYVGMVIEIKDNTVLMDFNHPLAGHNLVFDVEVV